MIGTRLSPEHACRQSERKATIRLTYTCCVIPPRKMQERKDRLGPNHTACR